VYTNELLSNSTGMRKWDRMKRSENRSCIKRRKKGQQRSKKVEKVEE